MGFLDNLKDKLMGEDDYYDDDYDDYYEDDQEQQPQTHGVLGNTARAEPESVSVYTRSGRPVSESTTTSIPTARAAANGAAMRTPAYDDEYDEYGGETQSIPARNTYQRVPEQHVEQQQPTDSRLKAIPRTSKLPPYVLKPQSYDDVQMVVRRVRTMQPVVISFVTTNIETAKRILDFSLGLSCGINGAVEELGDRVFVVLPHGMELTDADIDKLVADGTLEKRPDGDR